MHDFSCKMSLGLLATVALIAVSQSAGAQDNHRSGCAHTDTAWVETRMYLGLSKPGGAAVSKRELDEFVSNNLVARFPDGFTIIETTGYWRDRQANATVYENGRQVVILHEATPENETAVNEIAEQYRARFDQQSVLISSTQSKVRFCD